MTMILAGRRRLSFTAPDQNPNDPGRVEVLPASKSHVKVGSLVTACGSQ